MSSLTRAPLPRLSGGHCWHFSQCKNHSCMPSPLIKDKGALHYFQWKGTALWLVTAPVNWSWWGGGRGGATLLLCHVAKIHIPTISGTTANKATPSFHACAPLCVPQVETKTAVLKDVGLWQDGGPQYGGHALEATAVVLVAHTQTASSTQHVGPLLS